MFTLGIKNESKYLRICLTQSVTIFSISDYEDNSKIFIFLKFFIDFFQQFWYKLQLILKNTFFLWMHKYSTDIKKFIWKNELFFGSDSRYLVSDLKKSDPVSDQTHVLTKWSQIYFIRSESDLNRVFSHTNWNKATDSWWEGFLNIFFVFCLKKK